MRLALLVVIGCAGKVPDTRYYQLAPPPATPTSTAERTLALGALAVDPAYDDERIVYRTSPYRLDYYNYHRWSSSPGTLVANFLEQALERSGEFRSVVRETDGAPITLGGRVIALEEVDVAPRRWVARIVIELALVDTRTSTTLWSEQYEETELLTTQSPEGLARAVGVALGRIARRATPSITAIVDERGRVSGADVSRRP